MLEKLLGLFVGPNEENGKNNRKLTYKILAVLGMAGIVLMLLSNVNTPSPQTNGNLLSDHQEEVTAAPYDGAIGEEERIEERLKKVLSLVQGVGKVEVDITFEQGVEYVYGLDTSETNSNTEERDNTGGIRIIEDTSGSQNIVIVRDRNGEERPVVQTEKSPVVKGVLVVAEGAENPKVNAEVTRAVNTVLQVPLYKICVLPYRK